MSAASCRASAISSSLSFQLKRMYRQLMNGTSRPRLALLVDHRGEVRDRLLEVAALAVLHVALRRRAVDREGHLVDARVHEASRPLLGEGEAVGARVQVDVRELRLDVLAHLDGALVQERLAVVEEVDAPERGPASSITRVNRSKSSMPACRVRVIPVSGAQQAWLHEMLHAAVHSMYRRDGSGPTSRRAAAAPRRVASGSFSGQSPQNFDPPPLRSCRSDVAVSPFQIAATVAVRASPSTRLPYGSAQPQTMRPSQSMTSVLHGQEQREAGGEVVQGH